MLQEKGKIVLNNWEHPNIISSYFININNYRTSPQISPITNKPMLFLDNFFDPQIGPPVHKPTPQVRGRENSKFYVSLKMLIFFLRFPAFHGYIFYQFLLHKCGIWRVYAWYMYGITVVYDWISAWHYVFSWKCFYICIFSPYSFFSPVCKPTQW